MKIGFDIDDTLNDVRYKGIEVFNRHLGTNLKFEEVDKFQNIHFHEAFGISNEERKAIWKEHVHEIYDGCNPLKGAIETLNRWKDEGAEIFYVTARRETSEIRNITEDWLIRNGFPFERDNFHIGCKDNFKGIIAKELELDLFFEDKPIVISHLKVLDMNFAIKDQCYNQDVDHKRVYSWEGLSLSDFFTK